MRQATCLAERMPRLIASSLRLLRNLQRPGANVAPGRSVLGSPHYRFLPRGRPQSQRHAPDPSTSQTAHNLVPVVSDGSLHGPAAAHRPAAAGSAPDVWAQACVQFPCRCYCCNLSRSQQHTSKATQGAGEHGSSRMLAPPPLTTAPTVTLGPTQAIRTGPRPMRRPDLLASRQPCNAQCW